ncbi:acid protease [Ascoidea rubescens DSM 1968]|uniref:Acid protease n=1 Tax=Ascoidea rubescens DSM 1968 TaxID=1344418 RepID=A0A1D2VS53_9ASCO|nr:acid protease [Ascoidea rubescens DSM 1968]ODV64430.1 acid protease [Ascoidea rubescens DSM 1968]
MTLAPTHCACLCFILSLLLAVSQSSAYAFSKRDELKDLVIIDFQIHRGDNLIDSSPDNQPKFVKRDDYHKAVLTNEYTFYLANLTIGSDDQNVSVIIDTGSSDLWVTRSTNPYCINSNAKRDFVDFIDFDISNKIIENQNSTRWIESFKSHKFVKRDPNPAPDPAPNPEPNPAVTEITYHGNVYTIDVPDGATIIHISTLDPANPSQGTLASQIETRTRNIPTQTGSNQYIQATIDCEEYGVFDEDSSQTFRNNNTEFFIQYGDYTYALGTWGYDDVHFSGVTVTNLSFAVADQSNSSFGVFGVGLQGLQSSLTPYSNFPMKLVEQGFILKNVYSLYLDNSEADSGSLLFGAVDHAKYSGSLQTIPLVNSIPSLSRIVRFDVTLSEISINSSSNNFDSMTITTSTRAALLDCGTTLTYVPSTVFRRIGQALGGTYSSQIGGYIVECSIGNEDVYIDYNFQGVIIQVALHDVLIPVTSGRNSYCAIAIFDSGNDRVILGNSFLRSAYVVFNLDDNQISIAQAIHNANDSDIEVVTSTIPSAVTAASYSSSYTAVGSDSITSLSPNNQQSGSSSFSSSSNESSDSGASHFEVFALPVFLSIFLGILFI